MGALDGRTLLLGCDPFAVEAGPDAPGVLVLHGFTGCPQSVRPLAEAFADAGFGVELPLLPGHGTGVEDMMTTTWADWSGAAEAAYGRLASRCGQVVVAGLSMGGGLAAWLGSRHPEITGLVCVNPLIRIADDVTGFVRQLLEDGQDRMPGIGGDLSDPETHETGYEETPLAQLLSLGEGTNALRPELGKITCPVLLMTSPQDHVVPPVNSDELAEAVSGPVERISLERSFHVATLDHDQQLILTEATAFALRICS